MVIDIKSQFISVNNLPYVRKYVRVKIYFIVQQKCADRYPRYSREKTTFLNQYLKILTYFEIHLLMRF